MIFGIGQCFLCDTGIDVCQFRFLLKQGKHIQPGKILPAAKPVHDRLNKFQVCRSVHGLAQVPVIGHMVHPQNLEPARNMIEVWHDVFAFVPLGSIQPGFFQGGK